MFDNILCALGTIFSVIGLISAVYFLMMRLIRPGKNEKYYKVIVFDENEQNACYRVSFLLSQLISTGNIRNCSILAVDNGMTLYQHQSLIAAFGKEKSVIVCSPEKAAEIMFGKIQYDCMDS